MFSVGIISGSPDQVALAANPVLEEILAILTDEQSGNQAISDDISAIDSRLSSIESRLASIESELQTLSCSPTAEICDGIDNDCDGSVDEGDVCAAPECNVDNCATCASDDPNVCVACEAGFFADSTGQCSLQSLSCDLTDPSLVCGDGVHCQPDGSGSTTCADTTGTGTQGASCQTDSDCSAGFACLDVGSGSQCVEWCQSDSQCSAGTSCTMLSTPVIVDGEEYGVCIG